jgi:hypothetical protein
MDGSSGRYRANKLTFNRDLNPVAVYAHDERVTAVICGRPDGISTLNSGGKDPFHENWVQHWNVVGVAT